MPPGPKRAKARKGCVKTLPSCAQRAQETHVFYNALAGGDPERPQKLFPDNTNASDFLGPASSFHRLSRRCSRTERRRFSGASGDWRSVAARLMIRRLAKRTS